MRWYLSGQLACAQACEPEVDGGAQACGLVLGRGSYSPVAMALFSSCEVTHPANTHWHYTYLCFFVGFLRSTKLFLQLYIKVIYYYVYHAHNWLRIL